MKLNRSQIRNIFLLVLIAGGVCALCLHVVWLGDDLDYMFRMNGAIWQSWGWINTPSQFFASQWTHYLNVNGRFVAHALVQLFNGVLGQTAFAIANGIVWSLITVLLARIGGARRVSSAILLSAFTLLAVGFVTKMMPTCQIGYLWGLGINLLWVGLFLSGRRRTGMMTLLICIVSLVAGNWQEAYSIGIGGAAGVLLLSQWLRHPLKRLSTAQQLFAVCYIVGTATVCLSPSTLHRAAAFEADSPSLALFSPPGWLYALLSLRLFYVFIIVLIYQKVKGRIRLRTFFFSEMIWVTAMILLMMFNLVLGVFGNRQLFGIEMCSAVLTLRLLPRHCFTRFFLITGVYLVLLFYAHQYILAGEVRAQYDAIRTQYLESADGRVYYDRYRVSNEGFTREARIYEDIVGLYDNDPHHSLMKYWRHTYPGHRPLRVVPHGIVFKDTVWSYRPGHYVVIGHEGDTVTFRTTGLLKSIDRPYDFTKALKGPGGYRILVITPTDPWRIPTTPTEAL